MDEKEMLGMKNNNIRTRQHLFTAAKPSAVNNTVEVLHNAAYWKTENHRMDNFKYLKTKLK